MYGFIRPEAPMVGVQCVWSTVATLQGTGVALQSILCSSLPSTGLSGRSPLVAWMLHPEPPSVGSCKGPLLSTACPGLHTVTPPRSWPALPSSVPRAVFFHLPVDPGQVLRVPCPPCSSPAMPQVPGLPVVPVVSFIKVLATHTPSMNHCSECHPNISSFRPHHSPVE